MTALRRFLADRFRADLWWALGMLAVVLLNLAFFPSLEGDSQLDESMADLPPAVQAMFGIEEGVSIGSAAGYLQSQLFSSAVPIVLLVLAIALGSGAIGGSEDDGSLEFLLGYPVTRRTLLLSRFAGIAVVVVGHTLLLLALVFAFSPPLGALDDVDLAGLVVACLGSGALALLHAAVAFTVGAYLGRRTPAIAIASAVGVLGYIGHGLLSSLDVPEAVRYVSPWYWFLKENLLVRGATWVAFVPAVVLSLVIALAAIPAFERRDIHGS